MSYYWFNRKELLQKAKDKYHDCGGEEKVAEYYIANKYVIKKQIIGIKIFPKKKHKKNLKKNRHQNMKKTGQNINFCTV